MTLRTQNGRASCEEKTDIMPRELKESSPLVNERCLLGTEDQVKRHFSPHPPGGDLTDQLGFYPAAH